jgi:SpoIIAA-like
VTRPGPVAILLDVDNTLPDNDRIIADLKPTFSRARGTTPTTPRPGRRCATPIVSIRIESKESEMPIQLDEEDGGKVLAVHVSGKLAKADYEHFVPEFDRLVRQHGHLRLLFDMTGFHGWEASALWEDVKFGTRHFADIERLAMVGERKWQHGMATFCRPFTKATIRYFDHADVAEARKWLAETSAPGRDRDE